MSDRSTGSILIGIIAVAALGLSGFMFVKNEIFFPTSDTGLMLVGIWEDLEYNTGYGGHTENYDWLLEFRNSPLNDSNYIAVSNDNTRFVLATGLFKITLSLLLEGLVTPEEYSVVLLKNGETCIFFDYYETGPDDDSSQYQVCSSIYVAGNGINYFEINCFSASHDPFFSSSNSNNQLSIEYVK